MVDLRHNRVLLTIGNNRYHPCCEQCSLQQLKGAVNDSNALRALCDRNGFLASCFRDVTDKSEMLNYAKQANYDIKQADFVVFHYSGHSGDYHGQTYLTPCSAECDCNPGFEETQVFLHDFLAQLCKGASKATRFLVVIDGCRKARGEEPFGQDVPQTGSLRDVQLQIVFACGRGRSAYEREENEGDGKFHGQLTRALLACIDHQQHDSLASLLDAVKGRVKNANSGRLSAGTQASSLFISDAWVASSLTPNFFKPKSGTLHVHTWAQSARREHVIIPLALLTIFSAKPARLSKSCPSLLLVICGVVGGVVISGAQWRKTFRKAAPEQLEGRIEQLQAEKDQAAKEVEETRKQLETKESELSGARAREGALIAQQEGLQTKVKELEEQVSRGQEVSEYLKKQLTEAKEQLRNVSSELEDAKETSSNLQHAKDMLHDRLVEKEELLKGMRQRETDTLNDMDSQQAKVWAMTRTLRDRNVELGQSEARAAVLQKEKRSLEWRLEEKETKLKAMRLREADALKKVDNQKTQIQELESELKAAKARNLPVCRRDAPNSTIGRPLEARD